MWLLFAIAAWDVVSPAELERALVDGPSEIHVAPGVYRGHFVVSRPVHIVGDAAGTVLDGDGEGTVLSLKADDIVVEGLVVRHSGRKHTSEDAAIKATGAHIRVLDVSAYDVLFGVMFEQCK